MSEFSADVPVGGRPPRRAPSGAQRQSLYNRAMLIFEFPIACLQPTPIVAIARTRLIATEPSRSFKLASNLIGQRFGAM
jgi:hypothetical protein